MRSSSNDRQSLCYQKHRKSQDRNRNRNNKQIHSKNDLRSSLLEANASLIQDSLNGASLNGVLVDKSIDLGLDHSFRTMPNQVKEPLSQCKKKKIQLTMSNMNRKALTNFEPPKIIDKGVQTGSLVDSEEENPHVKKVSRAQ